MFPITPTTAYSAPTTVNVVSLSDLDKVIQAMPDQKIVAIKELRALTNLGLKEAKDCVDTMGGTNHLAPLVNSLNLKGITVVNDTKEAPAGSRIVGLDTNDILAMLKALVVEQVETNNLLKDLLEALSD